MPTQTVYIPYSSGTVLGSHFAPPWIADTAEHAAAVAWRGQPVFTARADVFDWLTRARAGNLRLLDFAIARVDSDTYTDPQGQRRIHIDWVALADPAHQVVRASADAGGPHKSVLNALYTGVHEHAAQRRGSASARAVTGRDPDADLVHTVWRRTYPIAYRDAAQVLADRIGHAAGLLLSDPDPRQDLDEATRAGLAALTRAGAALAASPVAVVPAPPQSVVDDTRWVSADQARGGWHYAVDRVWDTALITAAADGVLTAVTDLTNAWNSRNPADPTGAAAPARNPSASEQAVTGWLRRTLAETNRDVVGEWLHATGRNPHHGAPSPVRAQDLGAKPPPMARPHLHLSTVDATVQLAPAGAIAVAAPTRTGRGR